MNNFSNRIAGLIYGGAVAEAAAIEPEGTEFSTGTQLSLYVGDGLLEVLEWSAQGQAADPAASIWLALLRWYRNRFGAAADGVPMAPDRLIDDHPVFAGEVDDTTVQGLREVDMGLQRAPHGVDTTGTGALVRTAAVAMIPQMDDDWVISIAHQTAVLTHGDWQTPTAYSLVLHHVLAGESLLTSVGYALKWLDSNNPSGAALIREQLGGKGGTPVTAPQVLAAAIGCVADAIEQPVAPEHLFATAVTKAVNLGGNTQATALVTGQLAGGLLGKTAIGTPVHLNKYRVLEEFVDQWVGLTMPSAQSE